MDKWLSRRRPKASINGHFLIRILPFVRSDVCRLFAASVRILSAAFAVSAFGNMHGIGISAAINSGASAALI